MNSRLVFVPALVLFFLAAASCTKVDQPGEDTSGGLEFEISRTFHAPIRFSFFAGSHRPLAHLRAEIYAGKGGYAWGEIERVVERDISKQAFRELYRKAQGLNFKRILDADQPIGMDGSNWTMKLEKGGCTIVLNIWSPTTFDEGGERGLEDFVAIGKRLLDLAEIEIPEDEFY